MMFICTALILSWAMQTPVKIDPPAADSTPLGFFVRAAEARKAPEGLDVAAGDTLMRAVRFLLKDAGVENNAIRDEKGRNVPPYLYHAVIDDDDHFSYRISYPAFHHPYLIEAFLDYYNYTGDEEGIRR